MSETKRLDETPQIANRLPFVIRLIDRMSAVGAYGAAAAVVLLALNVFADVVGRKFFNMPLRGTLEMTAFWWMPTLTLLAFAFTEQRQEHIKVTILLDALPPSMRRIVEGSFGVLATGLLIALTYYTWVSALKSADIQQTTASTPPMFIWPFKFVAVAGVALLSLQAAATTYRYFAGHLPQQHAPNGDEDML